MKDGEQRPSIWPGLLLVGAVFAFFAIGSWIEHDVAGVPERKPIRGPILFCNDLTTNREKMACLSEHCAFDDDQLNAPHCRPSP